ncbi:uncharacterized protein [Centruroides vittatus]
MDEKQSDLSLEKLRNGNNVPGDNGRCVTNVSIPDWVDMEKFKRAKQLHNRYMSSISFGHLSGLFMIFLYTNQIEPFRINSNESRFVSLLRRYISTVNHVRKWYTGDIWNSEDPAHKSLLIVRNMHKKIADKTNKQFSDGSFMFGSQFAMAMTQFAFVGLITLFPTKLAIDWNKEDTECFLHFWRCIGYLLGMEDQYNICKGSYENVTLLFNEILEKEIKPGIKKPLEESVQMARDIVTTFRCVNPMLSWKSLSEYWKENLGISSECNLSIFDWLIYWWFRLVFNYLLWFQILRNGFNILTNSSVNKVLNNMAFYENRARKLETKLNRRKCG